MSQAVSAGKTRRLLGALSVFAVLTVTQQSPANALVAPIVPDQPPGSAAGPLPDSATGAQQAAVDQEGTGGPTSGTGREAGVTSGSSSDFHTDGASAWTTLRSSAQDALNAHTSDLSGPQLVAALGAPGTFTVNLRVDPAVALSGASVLDSAWVSCPRKSWCGPGQVVTIASLAGTQEPLQWSDYTGSVWDRDALGAAGRLPLTETPGNSLHVIQDPAVTPGAPGATTWAGQLWPSISDSELLPRPGQVLKVNTRSGTEGTEESLTVTTPQFPISVPVVNAATIGTIAGDTLTTDSDGRLALSLWRPQRLGATADSPVADMAGLNYGVLISDGTASVSCLPQRYSDGVGLAVLTAPTSNPGNAAEALPLRDSAPVDIALDQATPIGFTVDIGGCLADASQMGTQLGTALQATILAAVSPATSAGTDVLTAAGASSAGVKYQLVVPGR